MKAKVFKAKKNGFSQCNQLNNKICVAMETEIIVLGAYKLIFSTLS